ncbi:MAG: flagellar basal body rod C-terminal domain-containing protein [Alphaproteobacteria bacterium]|nr:flagellar basal body rod C-terminal domain-containing protein [Alphaproteobacteria bacterium]
MTISDMGRMPNRGIMGAGALLKGLYVATSGMVAQNQRTLAITQNIGNAQSRSTKPGEMPYQRKIPIFETYYDPAKDVNMVRVSKIHVDKSPPKRIYSPSDPGADEQGFVLETNVQPVSEIADMRDAARSHEAATKSFEKILQMLQSIIGVLKNA